MKSEPLCRARIWGAGRSFTCCTHHDACNMRGGGYARQVTRCVSELQNDVQEVVQHGRILVLFLAWKGRLLGCGLPLGQTHACPFTVTECDLCSRSVLCYTLYTCTPVSCRSHNNGTHGATRFEANWDHWDHTAISTLPKNS